MHANNVKEKIETIFQELSPVKRHLYFEATTHLVASKGADFPDKINFFALQLSG